MQLRARRYLIILGVLVLVLGAFSGPASATTSKEDVQNEPSFSTLINIIRLIHDLHVNQPDLEEIIKGAMKGAVDAAGDRYTTYMEKSDAEAFKESLLGTGFGGIGIHMEVVDGVITVVAPISGTPAEAAGIRSGDQVLAVDGKNIVGFTTDSAASLIRGEPGTPVVLTVRKAGTNVTTDVTLIRAVIVIKNVEADILCNGTIGYLRITEFTNSLFDQIQVVMDAFKDDGVKALIVDLRGNPGGLLGAAVDTSEFFVPSGPVVHIVESDGSTTTLSGGSDSLSYSPVIFLVDKGTASAAEILAGAVQDAGTGVLVGTQTFGKGTIQNMFNLPNGDTIKVTVAKYQTRSGRSIGNTGLTPDVQVPAEAPASEKVPPVMPSVALKPGDKSKDVSTLQQCLKLLGYNVQATGTLDSDTVAALKLFQESKQLIASGSVDTPTVRALNQALRAKGLGGFDYQLWKALDVVRMKTRIEW